MDSTAPMLRLTMVRPNLIQIPPYDLAPGFSLRWFRPGDERRWFEIQSAADRLNRIYEEIFAHQFGTDPLRLAQRQCYLCAADGNAIGTGTAWFDENFRGEVFGRVHWVAIVPEYQGKRLSRPLLTAVCERLRELGHERAYLTTSMKRRAAIRLYLRFGFEPLIETEEQARAWRTLRKEIGLV